MCTGLMVPVVCQNDHCNRLMWQHLDKHGYYAFYFSPTKHDMIRMRVTRSGQDIEKEAVRVPCPICHEETIVFVMKKPSAMRFHGINPEIQMIIPGQMRLPGEEEQVSMSVLPAAPKSPEFIQIEQAYRVERVYSDLIDEINTCYEYETYSSALVMVRKLIENLLVDILRFKYAPLNKHEMYFDAAKEQFLPLNTLISNFEAIVSEYIVYGFTRNHLAAIKGLRKKGNLSAHSIVDFVDRKKIDSFRSNANQAATMLIRIVGTIKGVMDQEGKLKKGK